MKTNEEITNELRQQQEDRIESGTLIGLCLASLSGAIVGWILQSVLRIAGIL